MSVAAQPGTDEETWSQFGYDDRNTGHAPENNGPTESVAEQWHFETDWPISSSPAVVDGTVYVRSDQVYALDAASGEKRWRFETRDAVWPSPAVVDGTVYVGSEDENVTCCRRETPQTTLCLGPASELSVVSPSRRHGFSLVTSITATIPVRIVTHWWYIVTCPIPFPGTGNNMRTDQCFICPAQTTTKVPSPPPAIVDDITPGTAVLFETPSDASATATAGCTELITATGPSVGNERILWVSLTRPPQEVLADWTRHRDTPPAATACLTTAPSTNEDAQLPDDGSLPPADDCHYEVLPSPADLTTLGVKIIGQVTAWDEDPLDSHIHVCIESLSGLRQYTTLDQTIAFLTKLRAELATAGAISYFHITPAAHDDSMLNTLRSRADLVLAKSGGEWQHYTDHQSE